MSDNVKDMTGNGIVSDFQVKKNIEVVLNDLTKVISINMDRIIELQDKKKKESVHYMQIAMIKKEIEFLVHQQKLFMSIRNSVLTPKN